MYPKLESCRREKDAADRSSFAGLALAHSDASAELRSRLEVADRKIEESKVFRHAWFLCGLRNEYVYDRILFVGDGCSLCVSATLPFQPWWDELLMKIPPKEKDERERLVYCLFFQHNNIQLAGSPTQGLKLTDRSTYNPSKAVIEVVCGASLLFSLWCKSLVSTFSTPQQVLSLKNMNIFAQYIPVLFGNSTSYSVMAIFRHHAKAVTPFAFCI